jgi:hypothetical protein
LKGFLEASKLLDIPIIVISNDRNIENYKKIYSKVYFIGEVSLSEFEAYIKNAKLFVVPLIETSNTSGLRAISLSFKHETCVLATATAPLTERFTDEVIFMSTSVNDITNQITRLYYDNTLRSTTVLKATAFYNTNGSSRAYAEEFQKVLDFVL